MWKFDQVVKSMPKMKNPVLIEGLPGIGNVGKIAVDFMIEELGAKKIYDISSYTFPHSVFVNEENLVELPSIELFHVPGKKHDLLLLTGDVQPIDEESSYSFCDGILEICKKHKVSYLITTGGIGLNKLPKVPKIYITGNDPKFIKEFVKGTKLQTKIYGVVGPIVGVTGLLIGLAQKRKMPAIALLSETLGHPMYLGVTGSREMLKVLSQKLGCEVNLTKLDKEIKRLEKDLIKRQEEIDQVAKETAMKKSGVSSSSEDQHYIG